MGKQHIGFSAPRLIPRSWIRCPDCLAIIAIDLGTLSGHFRSRDLKQSVLTSDGIVCIPDKRVVHERNGSQTWTSESMVEAYGSDPIRAIRHQYTILVYDSPSGCVQRGVLDCGLD